MAVHPDVLLNQEKIQSYFKHQFFSRYAPQFARKLGARGDRVTVIDGFSGLPHDKNGRPGSAPVLVNLALGQANVRVVLMERDPKYHSELKRFVDNVRRTDPRPLNVELVLGDTRRKLRPVVDELTDSHLLMYLDPCGYGIAFNDLVDMLNGRSPRWPSTEIMLNFGSGLVERIGGAYFAGTDDGATLTAACGGDWWIEVAEPHVRRDKNWSNALMPVITELTKRFEEATGKNVIAVPIRANPKHRPMFHMICVTPAGEGLFALGDSFARAWDDWHREGIRRALDGSLFEDDEDTLFDGNSTRGVDAAKRQMRNDVLMHMALGRSYVVGKSPSLWRSVLGRLTDAEVGQELRAMAAEGVIRLEKRKRTADYEIHPA